MAGTLHLLGPQRPTPNLPEVLASLPSSGPVVYITAGWRHDENDDEALQRDIGSRGKLLPIYAWFEELARTAPALFQAYHAKQQEIRKLKAQYRLRLDPSVAAVRILNEQLELNPDSSFLRAEFDDAIEVLRGLNRRFVAHSERIGEAFEAEHEPHQHPRIAPRIAQIQQILGEANAVLIAGGHVGVLLNRLEFFGVGPALTRAMESGTHTIAWSAGAMSLCDEVILFHDDPPMGKLNPEILDRGLGLAPNLVVLPHARERLTLDNKALVNLFAARFAPSPCIGMENGAWLQSDGERWFNAGNRDSAFQLTTDGTLQPIEGPHAPNT